MLYLYEQNAGIISARGNDRIDFFDRMSSNDLKNFPVDTCRKTVFTSDKGRIIDLVTLINLEEHTLMLTSPGYEDLLVSHLDKYIIMDDVKLEKDDEEYFKLIIWGDEVINEINTRHGINIEKNNTVHKLGDAFIFYDSFKFDSVNIISGKVSISKIKKELTGAKELSEEEFELFRIEKGIAEAENEINEQINPVEIGLQEYISYTKGCYIGQEVIARLDSQGKIPKQMVKIVSGNGISKEDKIFTEEEKECGIISSVAKDNGNVVGLGFIRSVNLDYDKPYKVRHNGNEIKIKISKVI